MLISKEEKFKKFMQDVELSIKEVLVFEKIKQTNISEVDIDSIIELLQQKKTF